MLLLYLNFWLGECAFVGKVAAKKHRIPSFNWLLGQDAKKNNRYFPLVKPRAESLVALSDFLAEEFYRNYKVLPAHIIPPGINTTDFPAPVEVRDIDILGAGSLIPLKRYEVFIKVVTTLIETNPALNTVICGTGPEKTKLQQMIDDAGLSGNIMLAGGLPHDEVLALMRRSKVFLHPSSYEGFATVYTEALYAGAELVGFCQPMQTVFNHQHIVKTEKEMVDKVSALLADRDLAHDSVLTWPIEYTCRRISALFGL